MSTDFLKRISFTSAFLIVIVGKTFAQEQPMIDSLITQLESDPPDSTKLTIYDLLTGELVDMKDSIMAEKYIDEGIGFAGDLDNDESRLAFMLQRVRLYAELDAHKRAIDWCERVLNESRQEGLMNSYAEALIQRGLLERNNDRDLAQQYFEESMTIARKIGDKNLEISAFRRIAFLLIHAGDYTKAIEYLKQCWQLSLKLDNRKVLWPLDLLGHCQTLLGEYKNALSTYKLYLNIGEEIGSQEDIANALSGLGLLTLYQGKKEKALTYFHKCYAIRKKIGKPLNKVLSCIAQAHSIPDSSLYYHRLAVEAAEDFNSSAPVSYAHIGFILIDKNDIDSGRFYINKALDIFQDDGATAERLWLLQTAGSRLSKNLQFQPAINYYFEALSMAEASEDTFAIAETYVYLSSLYNEQHLDSISLMYQQKALHLFELQNRNWYAATVKLDLADHYMKTKQYNQSLQYYAEASNSLFHVGDSCFAGSGYISMGEIYILQNKSDSAQYYYNMGESLVKDCESPFVNFRKYLAQGQLFDAQGKMLMAIDQYEKAIGLIGSSDAILASGKIDQTLEWLYLAYEKVGKIDKAYETYKRYDAFKDSIFNADNTRLLAQKETAYAYEKANQERELSAQAERAAQEQKLIRQRWISFVSLGAFVVVFFLVLAVYRNYRNKQKANLILMEKNREIEKQKQELQELDKFKSNFFANVSHELRTPLTLISGPLEKALLSDTSQIPPSLQQTLKLVANNSKKLKGLVNDILDLSKLDSKKLELTLQAVDLGPFVHKIFSNYEAMAQQLGIQYNCSTQDLSSDWVLLDDSRVEKVLNNLLFNALKYTPEGGTVGLHVTLQNESIVTEVTDTGQGIAETDLPFIFDRYFQSKQPDAPIQGGTGIGLALAYELTILMDGTLTVASQLDEGTTFTISLPLQTTAPSSELAEEKISSAIEEPVDQTELPAIELEEKEHHILIVEDNPDMQMFVKELVDKNFYTHLASNGKQALDLLDKHSIDLIISDVMMPEMDGYTLLQQLKESDSLRSIPVVMLTALDHEDSKLQALAIGVDDYLTKPFSPQELIARIHNLLARHQLRRHWISELKEDNTEDAMAKAEGEEPFTFVLTSDIDWLKQVEERIREELENDDFLLSDLAESMHLSERGFQRKIKKITGLTPKQYQHEIALQKGRELLEKGVYGNVTAVAYAVGINHVSRFSNLYHKRFGKKPSEYFRVHVG